MTLAAEEGINYRIEWKEGDHQEDIRIFQVKDDGFNQGGGEMRTGQVLDLIFIIYSVKYYMETY